MLVVIYTPGFSPVRHRCTVEVSPSGHLRQILSDCRKGEWTAIGPVYEVDLAAPQLESIDAAITRIDFQRLSARLRPRLDASKLAIELHHPDRPPTRVEGPILSYDRGYHDFRQRFEPAQQLWKTVYSFLPKKFIECA